MAKQFVNKKMSTRAQMLLTGAITITLGFVVTIGVLSWQSSNQQKALAEQYLQKKSPAVRRSIFSNSLTMRAMWRITSATAWPRCRRPGSPIVTWRIS